MKRLYGKYRVEDVLIAYFPDRPTHVSKLAQMLTKAVMGSVSGAASRLCLREFLDRTAPGVYAINEKGKQRRTKFLALLQKEGIRP